MSFLTKGFSSSIIVPIKLWLELANNHTKNLLLNNPPKYNFDSLNRFFQVISISAIPHLPLVLLKY